MGRHGARRQRRGDPLRRHVLRRHAARLGRPQPRPGPGRRRAAADAGQPRHRHGERPHAAAALLVPPARAEGGRRPHGRRPQLQLGGTNGQFNRYLRRQPARMLGRAVAVRALDLLPLPGDARSRTPRRRPSRPRASSSRCTSGCRATPPVRRRATATATTSRAPRPRQRPRRAARRCSARPTRASSRRRPTATTASSTATGPACRASSSANGIRLDTNYYYWPGSWVQDRPGFFTGSGFPKRFAETDGSLIDVYQAATQITDESGQDVRQRGQGSCSTTRSVLRVLRRRHGQHAHRRAGQPRRRCDHRRRTGAWGALVSARQMLTWLDGRNTSSFQGLAFSGGRLTFSVPRAPARPGCRRCSPRAGRPARCRRSPATASPWASRRRGSRASPTRPSPRMRAPTSPPTPRPRAAGDGRGRRAAGRRRDQDGRGALAAHRGADLPAPEAQHHKLRPGGGRSLAITFRLRHTSRVVLTFRTTKGKIVRRIRTPSATRRAPCCACAGTGATARAATSSPRRYRFTLTATGSHYQKTARGSVRVLAATT